MHHILSYSDSYLYWCSAYIWRGYFWPTYICHSNVSVPAGSGRYR